MIVLLPCYSLEDFSIYRTPEESNQIFSAFSAVYHPALIEAVDKMPQWERAGNPLTGRKRRLIVIPPCCEAQLPHAWLKEAEESDAVIVRNRENRDEIAAEALERLGCRDHGFSDDAVESFYALGFCHLSAELLSRKLRYMSNLDTQNFTLKTLAAVKALRAGNEKEYADSIQRAFELLAESKTYFFPTATKLLDLTWLSRSDLAGPLLELLQKRRKKQEQTNLVLPTFYLDTMRTESTETFALLAEEIAQGRVTLVGGDLDEAPLNLLPPAEALLRLIDGLVRYAEAFGVRPKIFARNSAGYALSLPTLLKGTGYDAALFFTHDGWRQSRENQSRIDWRDPQGTTLPVLARAPIDAESDKSFMEMADRIGYGANADYVQTTVFEHRPLAERPWLSDMARMNRFAKVLGETTTLTDYFAASVKTGYRKEYEFDDFRTNRLTRSGKENRPDPISLWVTWRQVRAAMERLSAVTCFAALTGSKRSFTSLPGFERLEQKAQKLEQLQEAIESVLFRPAELETAFDDEAQRSAAEKKVAAEMLQDAERARRLGEEFEKIEDEINPSFAELLYRVLSPSAPKDHAPTGTFFVNCAGVDSPVPVSLGQTAPAPELEPLIERRSGGDTLTLPPFSAVWIPTDSTPPNDPATDKSADTAANKSTDQNPASPSAKGGFFKRLAKRFGKSAPTDSGMIEFRQEVFSDQTLDRFYAITNRFFELKIDEATGQVRSLRTFSAPSVRSGGGILRQPAMGNRLAWQIAMRLTESGRQSDVRPAESAAFGYTIMAADRIEILCAGPPRAVLRITGTLVLPTGERAASFVETMTVTENSREIDVELALSPILLPSENPWENYYGVRFAWHDAFAEISAGVGGGLWPTSRDFIQAPECVDIKSDEAIRLTILTNGLTFHRKRGDRRLDTILLPKNESARTFRFRVGVDLPDPLEAAERFCAPSPLALDAVLPTKRPLVRFLEIEPSSVRPILLEPVYRDSEQTILRGFRLILQEKSGKKTPCCVSTRFALASAQKTDFLGSALESVPLENARSFTVDLAAHEILALELELTR